MSAKDQSRNYQSLIVHHICVFLWLNSSKFQRLDPIARIASGTVLTRDQQNQQSETKV